MFQVSKAALLLVALAVLGSPAAVSSEPGSGQARFSYAAGSQLDGDFRGGCDALGVAFAEAVPGSLVLDAKASLIRLFETWINYTTVRPTDGPFIRHDLNVSQEERVFESGPGQVRLAWVDGRDAGILAGLGYPTQVEEFNLSFSGKGFRSGLVESGYSLGQMWVQETSGLREKYASIAGWGRTIQFSEAEITAAGNLSVHLHASSISGQGVELTVPANRLERTMIAPGVDLVTETQFHALVEVENARFDSNQWLGSYFCYALTAEGEGRFVAYRATGAVERAGQSIRFEDRELSLDGSYRLEDEPGGDINEYYDSAPAEANVEGDFQAVGIDFVPAPLDEAGVLADPRLYLGVAAAAGAGWALWKVAAFLFTRLRPDQLLNAEGRRRVHEAIQANPGASLLQVARVSALPPDNALYHIEVLNRHARIRSFKVRGAWRYAPVHHDARKSQRDVLLAEDAPLRETVLLIGRVGCEAKSVVTALRDRFGLSRSGCWKVIDRACQHQMIRKERRRREVYLRLLGPA